MHPVPKKCAVIRLTATSLLIVMWLGCTSGCNSQKAGAPSAGNVSPVPSTPQTQSEVISPPLLPTAPVSDEFQFDSAYTKSGIDFVHESGDSEQKAFPAANGSGVGVIDFDRDGLRDLLFLTNNRFEEQQASLSNEFYRNRGDLKFVDISAASGLGFAGFSAGVAIADFNCDGLPDVYLACYGENQLFENLGDGTFQNVSVQSLANDDRWGTSAAFLDFDNDGLLDLYVGNYAKWTPEAAEFCGDHKRKIRMYCGPKSVPPEEDVLYRNNGDGTFTDVSESAGILAVLGRAQGVLALDMTNDSLTDLYVSNDLNPNTLWVNKGDGRFEDQAPVSGVAYDHNGIAQAGMGIAFGDGNRDGRLDLFVTNFEGEHNAYYEQAQDGFFNDVSHLRGLAAASFPWIGWGTSMSDFNLDGWQDILVINGHTDNNLREMGREGIYAQPPLLWKNDRGVFTQVTPRNSPYFESLHPGRGLAVADLDNDLDWDVVCNHQDTVPELLQNVSPRSTDAVVLQLQFVGGDLNRDAIGTVVTCQLANRLIVEQVTNGGSYLSASDARLVLVLAASEVAGPLTAEIRWGPGQISQIELPATSGSGIVSGNRFFPIPSQLMMSQNGDRE